MEPIAHRVQVLDCDLNYLRRGSAASEKPGILFIHGTACHARWWSFIAPFFCADRPVAAIDLSGMEDRGWREFYGSNTNPLYH